MKHLKNHLVFLLILSLGIFLRFQNINWDANMHLHPDERFLTMVGNAMKLPASLAEYLNPQVSGLNPTNVGFPFFVYGVFPLVLNKILALLFGNDSYHLFTLQGRLLSGLFDIGIVFVLYYMAMLFEKKEKLHKGVKYFAPFIYAISVYPIQISHFFTADTFLTFFLFTSLYKGLSFHYEKKLSHLILSSALLGLAFASKISAVYMLPLIWCINFFSVLKEKKWKEVIFYGIVFFGVLYLSIRLFNPYYFESVDILNVSVNKIFFKNIADLKAMSDGKVWFPPAVQWYTKQPILFSLFNLVFIGFGLFHFLFAMYGFLKTWKLHRKRRYFIFFTVITALWMTCYFLYNAVSYVKSIRYLIFIFPILSLYAGLGLAEYIKIRNTVCKTAILVLLLAWPLMFTSIYLFQNTRVEASKWIYEQIPNNSRILTEYWDDPLPLPIANTQGKTFDVIQVPVFDPDNEDKWEKLKSEFKRADYYILSSNRGWGSIPTVPEKYPIMSKYYIDLFDGKSTFMMKKRFVPLYQELLPFHPLSWVNNWVEELFTVYDHPSVFIFKKK